MDPLLDQIMAEWAGLKSRRTTWESHWQEARDLIHPLSPGFTVTQETPGARRHKLILDSTALQAADTLAQGLQQVVASPVTEMFELEPQNRDLLGDDDAMSWCADTEERVRDLLASPLTRYVQVTGAQFRSWVTFGTGAKWVDRRGEWPVFRPVPLANLWIGSDEAGRVDRAHRLLRLPARAAVAAFPKIGAKVREKAGRKSAAEDLVEILHVVRPREGGRAGKAATGKPWGAYWVDLTEKAIFDESGHDDFPYIVPRFDLIEGEDYGRGPGLSALPDARMLQEVMSLTLTALENSVSPPLQVPHDGLLNPVSLRPRALNYVYSELLARGGDPIRPIQTGARPDLGQTFMEDLRQRINRAFWTHLFIDGRDPRSTLGQVLEIKEQNQLLLNPIIGAAQAEDVNPTITLVVKHLLERGKLRPLPRSLSEKGLKVAYASPMAKARKIGEVRAMQQLLEIFAPLWQADPGLLDNVDQDAAFRLAAERLGVPRQALRLVNAVRQTRDQRQQQQAAMAQTNQVGALAEAAGQASPMVAALANLQQAA
jgi:hypothetical protein